MAEQLKLSLYDGVHHRPLPLHLSSDFIVGDVIVVLPVFICASAEMPGSCHYKSNVYVQLSLVVFNEDVSTVVLLFL